MEVPIVVEGVARGSTPRPGERHLESWHTAQMDVWYQRFHNPHLQLPGETFPRGGYKGVPDGYVYEWPHATSWPNIPKKKGKAWRGVEGGAGIKSYMTKKLFEVELWQAIAKLVVTCDLPFKIVEAEA
ncbi:unnamed protein product, partial [Closterium sp. NIES-53]